MPIWSTVVHTSSRYKYEIEADNSEDAEELASEKCLEENAPDSIDDVEVEIAMGQYTDQQELQDEEERYAAKED
jgi:hypothetical protein